MFPFFHRHFGSPMRKIVLGLQTTSPSWPGISISSKGHWTGHLRTRPKTLGKMVIFISHLVASVFFLHSWHFQLLFLTPNHTLFENYSKCRILNFGIFHQFLFHQNWTVYCLHSKTIWQQKLFHFPILAFSTNFWPIKIDLPGNILWLRSSSGFQKPNILFLAFCINFWPLNYKRSSLRS